MNTKHIKRLILLSLTALLAFSVNSYSQNMSDESILQYVTEALAAGKSNTQIGQELLSRGVSTAQIKRLLGQVSKEGELPTGTAVTQQKDQSGQSFRQRSDFAEKSKAILAGKDKEEEVKDSLKQKKTVPIYGHDIFGSKNLSFEPNENAATPETYVLGPGDEVIIDVWGASEVSVKQMISPDGRINVPQVGPIALGGMTIKDAGKKVAREFGRVYSTDNVSLTLGQVRSIKVHVMGDVKVPGTYRLSSFATVFTALYRAGGITDIGSIREVRVSRGGKLLTTVDIYKYLIEGDTSCDITLHDGDVVNVPPYSNLVTVEGRVKRPMRYEMAEGETLDRLIAYSGGFAPEAHTSDVRVTRKGPDGPEVYSVNMQTSAAAFALRDGDVVEIDSVRVRFTNRLEVKGAVGRPGTYRLGDGVETVCQLVEKAGGLNEDAFLGRAQIIREKDDLSLEVIAIALGGIIDGSVPDLPLKNNDILFVASRKDIESKGPFSINGYVLNPGEYPYADNTTVEDLILLAGGLEDGASTVRVDVSRRIHNSESTMPSDTLAEVFSFSIADGLVVEGRPSFILEPYDVVAVRRSPGYVEQRKVTITGEVAFPGEYTLVRSGETVSELIARAGGPTAKAYLKGGILKRRSSEYEQNILESMKSFSDSIKDSVEVKISKDFPVGVEIDKAVSNPGSEYDIVLREGDEILIPEILSTVGIQGDVLFPNTVSYIPGKRISYYINEAGGFGEQARKRKVYVVYMNGNVSAGRNSKVEPGCEIVVPSRPARKGLSAGEMISLGTSTASFAAMIVSLVNLLK
ncbi:MAG: SLBB domain-containing protein [Candidatus Cryptobacteroides sp.]